MRWRTTQSVTWPDDASLQRAWAQALQPLREVQPQLDGTIATPPGEPTVRLVAGTHLQRGAAYRIAPELTRGVVRGWVVDARDAGSAGFEWAPSDEPGRARGELHGLDRIERVEVESDLRYARGKGHLDLTDPGHLVQASLELDWLTGQVTGQVHDGRATADLELRGRGLWRPVLALLLRAASSSIQRSLDESARELATELTALGLPPGGTVDSAASGTTVDQAPPTPWLTDAHLDLSWLASPWTILRYARSLSRP